MNVTEGGWTATNWHQPFESDEATHALNEAYFTQGVNKRWYRDTADESKIRLRSTDDQATP